MDIASTQAPQPRDDGLSKISPQRDLMVGMDAFNSSMPMPKMPPIQEKAIEWTPLQAFAEMQPILTKIQDTF